MGMIAEFHQVTDRQIAEFLRRPSSAYDYIQSPLFEDANTMAIAEKMFAELRMKTAGLSPRVRAQVERIAGTYQNKSQARKGPQLVKPGREPEPERKKFSLEKDWHVLHYALNGTHDGGNGPLADAILGGSEIPDVEGVNSFGSGSSAALRYLTPAQVQDVAAALLDVEPSGLLSKLNFADAQEKKIYLGHTLDDLEGWSYLPDLFCSFCDFYAEAAGSGKGMLLSIV